MISENIREFLKMFAFFVPAFYNRYYKTVHFSKKSLEYKKNYCISKTVRNFQKMF